MKNKINHQKQRFSPQNAINLKKQSPTVNGGRTKNQRLSSKLMAKAMMKQRSRADEKGTAPFAFPDAGRSAGAG